MKVVSVLSTMTAVSAHSNDGCICSLYYDGCICSLYYDECIWHGFPLSEKVLTAGGVRGERKHFSSVNIYMLERVVPPPFPEYSS
jgi:hypothetical protein